MLLGLIADIHADPRALETALRRLEALGAGTVLCAGDLVGYGSQPDAVATLLRDRAVPCVRGNHDRWALERRQVIGPWGRRPAAWRDETWDFLRALPPSLRVELAGRTIEVHHGSPSSDTEFVTPYKPLPESVERLCDGGEADVVVLGHTHIPMIERRPRGLLINPGSVLGVPGIQTSYSFAVVELATLAVRVFEVGTGREIRRDPIFLADA